MTSSQIQSVFNAWLDKALSAPIPDSIIAFNFNLAEPWSIEIVGSSTYDETNEDWACQEDFRSDFDPLELPYSEVGTDWETVLESAKVMIHGYLNRSCEGSRRLMESKAVTVGFVDGNLHKMWPRPEAS